MRHCPLVTAILTVAAMSISIGVCRSEEATAYTMRGVLRGIDPTTGQVTVSHDAVPGYMPAMTMNFDLADPAEIKALHSGDTFNCRLRVARDHAWIEAVHREDVQPVANIGTLPVSRSTELKVGDSLPETKFINERGETLHLRDFRGKSVAITFIYLRCPLPTYCPLINRNFQAAQTLLVQLGLKERTHFLSISMDAENDTPAQLASFAQAHEADEHSWSFATVPEPALRCLGSAVGLEFERKAGAINHNLRTVVIDPEGKIRRVFRGNTWTPQELAAELRAALGMR